MLEMLAEAGLWWCERSTAQGSTGNTHTDMWSGTKQMSRREAGPPTTSASAGSLYGTPQGQLCPMDSSHNAIL